MLLISEPALMESSDRDVVHRDTAIAAVLFYLYIYLSTNPDFTTESTILFPVWLAPNLWY